MGIPRGPWALEISGIAEELGKEVADVEVIIEMARHTADAVAVRCRDSGGWDWVAVGVTQFDAGTLGRWDLLPRSMFLDPPHGDIASRSAGALILVPAAGGHLAIELGFEASASTGEPERARIRWTSASFAETRFDRGDETNKEWRSRIADMLADEMLSLLTMAAWLWALILFMDEYGKKLFMSWLLRMPM